jgi:hypothetical protein
MKSQRRHDLETNWLAQHLTVWGDRLRPYSKAITVTTAVAACIVIVWLVASKYAAAQRQRAWDVYTYAIHSANPDWGALREAAEEHSGTPMGEMAGITWADAELRQATENFFTDEDETQEHLENAIAAYRRLIDEADDAAIVNRARLGMGRALETDGKAKEAIEFYSAVGGPFATFAKERAEKLRSTSTQEAIAWLATADLPEIQAPLGPGTPGLRPPFGDFDLVDPAIPTTQFPSGLNGPILPGANTTTTPTTDVNQPPLEIQNPFAGPSDPNRYATPPADDAEGPPPAAGETDGQSADEPSAAGSSSDSESAGSESADGATTEPNTDAPATEEGE